ncbi:hypothetical protein M1D70_09305 [Paenibacillus sp. AK002]
MTVKKKIKSLFVIASVLALTTSSLGSATAAPIESKPDFIEKADQVLISTKNNEDRINQLEELGWEVVETSSDDRIMTPFSPSGCGSVINENVLKQWDAVNSRYMYLIQAGWDFNDSCSDFDDTSGNAPDILAIAVVNGQGKSVGVQGEFAQIYVRDEDGDDHPTRGNVSGPSGSGIVYTIDDQDGFTDNIGDNGDAWFYIQKPSGTGPFYVQSKWRHTWTSTQSTLTGVGITYGTGSIGLNATWNTTTTPLSWDAFDSSLASF